MQGAVRNHGAAVVFAVACVAVVPIVMWTNRDQWFFLDEWDFLANRGLTHGLLEPHSEHWTTLPIIVYRALFTVVGIHHYWPYQLLAIAVHVLVAVLLRAVMLRADVNPWIATAATSLFVLFGSGRQNIAWGFQITFTAALAFGLGMLLVHRWWIATLLGLGALMCSGVGVFMVAGAGLAWWLRHGWRTALAIVGPLALIYGVWSNIYGEHERKSDGAATFVREMIAHAFMELGRWWPLAVVFGGLAIVGLARRDANVLGLAASACFFAAGTAYGRAGGILANPSAGRYAYIVAALLLPAIAVGIDTLSARRPSLVVIGVLLLVIAIPGNIREFTPRGATRFQLGSPAKLCDNPTSIPGVTARWAAAQGVC